MVAQAYKEVFYQPFTQATGIEIINVSTGPDPIVEIRTMVEAGRYLWHMAGGLSNQAVLLLTTGKVYLEKHGLEDDPIISLIPPQFRSPYSVGTLISTIVLAYQTDTFKARPLPKSWADLWDVDRFPGRRSLPKHPALGLIEIALMADGVRPSDVYPCNLNRAFRSLDKIKPHLAAWWAQPSQTEQMLKSGEIDLIPAFINRVQSAINTGAPIAFAWQQHLFDCQSWAILKGTPHADACRQFIQFASDPKRQARLTLYRMGPTQPDAFNSIDAEHAKLLPTYPDNLKKGLYTDASYWLKNQHTVIERFNDWLLS